MKGIKNQRIPGILRDLCFGLPLLSLLIGTILLGGCQPAPKPSVEISEVVSSNGLSYVREGYGAVDWIELHNAGEKAVSLRGWFLTDKYDSLDADCALPPITLQPDGYCVLFADKQMADAGSLCLPFGLSKEGETLYLFSSDGEQVDKVQVPALEKDVSWAKGPDGDFGYCLLPTPENPNRGELLTQAPTASTMASAFLGSRSAVPLRINEICSASGTAEADWIELCNPSDEAVIVTGFYLSDSASDATKGILPSLTVPAGGYLTVPLGPTADPKQGVTAFSLSSAGEEIYLFDRQMGLVDTVYVPAMSDGLVYARGRDGVFGYCGVPTPGTPNTSAVHGAPLRAMDAGSPLRINEGLFRNRYSAIDAYGDHSDWVELVNGSKNDCSLKGYYLSDDRNDLAKWPLPDRTLAPGEYLLVFLSGKASTENELHASFAVSDRDEGCFLYSAEGLEVELLPYPKDLPENVSVGLDQQGNVIFYAYPTPGGANAQGFSDKTVCGLPAGDILISEVCAGGAEEDWIELYNRGIGSVNLLGWHLSDDPKLPQKLSLGNVQLKEKEYYVVSLNNEGELASPFSISLSGEELVLSDESGFPRDVFVTGALSWGLSSGRREEAPQADRVFFAVPTRGTRNTSKIVSGYAPSPLISDLSLYHDAPFALTMGTDDPAATIHYTLDGSEPTERSPVYTDPLLIGETTCVRAIACKEKCFPSAEAAATYLFREPHTLPVVCLSVEQHVWKDISGAPINKKGLLEYPARISYYESDGTMGISFPAGISPRGNASIRYPQKSLSIHLRGKYGRDTVAYPFFNGQFTPYRFLILRNGSQDRGETRLRDSFASRAAANLKVMTAKTRPVIVYVNGAYYGIMDLNEGMNKDFLWTYYQVDGKDVNIVSENDVALHGSAKGFVQLRKSAASKQLASADGLTAFSEVADIDAITDYLIAESFFGNYDIHNQRWWNSADGTIKWQPILYDTDRCLHERSYASNVLRSYFSASGFARFGRDNDRYIYMEIPCGLRQNKAWCRRFLERYVELLHTEFAENRLHALLDEMADALRPEMEEHIRTWDMPLSMAAWEANITQMHQIITKQHVRIVEHIKGQFSLSNKEWNALLEAYGG